MTIVISPTHSFVYDGASINIYHANKGEGLPKHTHEYAHATFCTSGSVIVTKETKSLKVDKFTQPINLVENEWHEIKH